MNRAGLAIALAVAAVVGVVFAGFPSLDIAVSALFYEPQTHRFVVGGGAWEAARETASWIITLLVAPAFLAVIGKLLMPRRRMLIEGRAALLLVTTLALGPGVLANQIMKQHSGRMRPADIVELGGIHQFTPWWDLRGECTENCSFIAGEPSGAFWTFAPTALAPPQWRVLAYGGALGFGALVGFLRIAAGGHFFTDVVFAGVLMFLLVWTAHGLVYRWPATRISEDSIERPLVRVGEALRDGLAALARRIAGRPGKPS